MKCRYLMTTLGFDSAVDRHAEDFPRVLQEVCPDGLDAAPSAFIRMLEGRNLACPCERCLTQYAAIGNNTG